MEPRNSMEVCYAISVIKPHVKLDLDLKTIHSSLEYKTKEAIRYWMYNECTNRHQWFKDHI